MNILIGRCFVRHCHCPTCYLPGNMRSVLTTERLMMVYYAQVETKIRYGICFWGMSSSSRDVFI